MRLESFIRQEAARLGFCAVGFAPAGPSRTFDRFREWLARGYAGDMLYLSRHTEMRSHPDQLLPGVKSLIVVAARYPAAPRARSWSAYAAGRDYHAILRGKLKELERAIRRESSVPLLARICVDSAPLLEREWACRAGLGWIGRQGSLVNPEHGCCLFLGELLVNLELAASPPVPDQCGDCRLCVAACPAGALQPDGFLDARRCIAYLTIEHKGEIPAELRPLIGASLFGCDRCTAVCPWNRKGTTKPTPDPSKEGKGLGREPRPACHRESLAGYGKSAGADRGVVRHMPDFGENPIRREIKKLPSLEGAGVGSLREENSILPELRGADEPLPSPEDCLAMTEDEFARRFAGTAVRRLGLKRLRRNAMVVIENG